MNVKPLEFYLQDRLHQGLLKVPDTRSGSRYVSLEMCTVYFTLNGTPDAEVHRGRFRVLQDRLDDHLLHVRHNERHSNGADSVNDQSHDGLNSSSVYLPMSRIEVSDSMLSLFF